MTSPAATDRERLARAIGDAVLAVPGVAGLASGGPVEVATLYPGGKVAGIRLGDPVEVHVTVAQVPIGPVAERVRDAVQTILAGTGDERPVVVDVDDLATSALAPAPGR